ncbi:flagellar biosynthetic protein FlhB [Pseudidiomarina maritima]|jgi:flagellar biosynthetic protein FlhB|uniref:Flagellar biosynthetic protein FlhB n=1 Tax=Pseudidiomarina maritima TaxID=519453 RepID=A0A1I6HMT0_9GAMM|nr:flagellar biosynthesis protein FlhB [Pseudidiomarina maritima]SFR55771.1 flagellar biosynthetic protein FlhB [Pseudidiomarina maritima]
MAEEQTSDQEKTEDPTARRLEKSREEGQVARSRELTTFVILFGGVLMLWALGSTMYHNLGLVMEQAFLFERLQVSEPGPMLQNVLELGQSALFSLLPLFAVMMVLALVAPALLGGWVISAKAMAPKLSKLNPIKGLKRVFSTQALAELGKAIAKSVLVGSVLMLFLWDQKANFLRLMSLEVKQALGEAMSMAALACFLMILTLLVVVAFDVPFQLFTHTKKLRMSKEEVKRESKETEGDPHVKGKIRQQQQAMARRRMMTEVPKADVIVTNPTHYAVALKYDDSNMGAPRVVAKGTDLVAQRIRELGDEHKVPRLEAPPLARALHTHVDLGHEIPAPLYTAVAEVLAWAFQLKRARNGAALIPPTPTNISVPDDYEVPAP